MCLLYICQSANSTKKPARFGRLAAQYSRSKHRRMSAARNLSRNFSCIKNSVGSIGAHIVRSYGRKNPLPFSFSKRSPVSGLRRIRKQRETGVKRVETAGVCPLARRRGCGEPPSRPDGVRSISDSKQFDEDLYSDNNLHDKNLHFVQSISCHKRHDLIIYKVYCCFACQMTKQHN